MASEGGLHMKRLVPWIVLGVFVVYLADAMFRPFRSPQAFDLGAFGRLPVLMGGRLQPVDSVARLGLLQIRGTATVPAEGTSAWRLWERTPALDATEWLLEVLTKPDAADTRKIFPIQHPALLEALKLQAGAHSGPTYYAFKDLAPKLEDIGKLAGQIAKINASGRVDWEQEGMRLRNAVVSFERLKNSLQPNSFLQGQVAGNSIAYDFAAGLTQYQIDLRVAVKAAVGKEHGKTGQLDEATNARLGAFARPYFGVARAGLLALIPPADPVRARERWRDIGSVVVDSVRTGQVPPAVMYFAVLSSTFAQGKPEDFNRELANYAQWLTANGLAHEVSKVRYEFFYNQFQPFVRATAVYLLAFVLLCASFLSRGVRRQPDHGRQSGRPIVLYRSAAMLVLLAGVLHTTGLLFEMMLVGRLPVTNMYDSIIAAGWAMVLVASALEWFWRRRIGLLVGALAGLAALSVASSLAPGGVMELTRAVFDLSFFLATAAIVIALRLGGEAGSRMGGAAPSWRWRRQQRQQPQRQEALPTPRGVHAN